MDCVRLLPRDLVVSKSVGNEIVLWRPYPQAKDSSNRNGLIDLIAVRSPTRALVNGLHGYLPVLSVGARLLGLEQYLNSLHCSVFQKVCAKPDSGHTPQAQCLASDQRGLYGECRCITWRTAQFGS